MIQGRDADGAKRRRGLQHRHQLLRQAVGRSGFVQRAPCDPGLTEQSHAKLEEKLQWPTKVA